MPTLSNRHTVGCISSSLLKTVILITKYLEQLCDFGFPVKTVDMLGVYLLFKVIFVKDG